MTTSGGSLSPSALLTSSAGLLEADGGTCGTPHQYAPGSGSSGQEHLHRNSSSPLLTAKTLTLKRVSLRQPLEQRPDFPSI